MSRTPSTTSPARRLAHEVLLRVTRDAAYADRALDAALARSPLKAADRALATELVYGTLRAQIYLDFLLGQLATRPLRKLPASVLVALRMAAYQITGTRVPDHAAVHDAVSLVRSRHTHAAGFANALLRRLATLHERGELPRPDRHFTDPLEALAVAGSHPLWLVRELARVRGEAAARAWVAANNERPPLALRVNLLRAEREKVAEELKRSGYEVVAPESFPQGLWLLGAAGAVAELPGFAAGEITVQDLGAQLVAVMAGVRPGQVVLDACAAPGGKATHLAELMRDEGVVLASDVHPAKTRLIAANAERMGLASIRVAAVDAGDPVALAELLHDHGREQVDAVLLDAPCSGLGTLRRNPELRSQAEEAIGMLTHTQDRLLDATASLLAPGGVLVYAVCTVTEAEGPERVRAALARHPELRVERPGEAVLQPFLTRCTYPEASFDCLRTWTDLHRVDSFFAVKLRKSERDGRR